MMVVGARRRRMTARRAEPVRGGRGHSADIFSTIHGFIRLRDQIFTLGLVSPRWAQTLRQCIHRHRTKLDLLDLLEERPGRWRIIANIDWKWISLRFSNLTHLELREESTGEESDWDASQLRVRTSTDVEHCTTITPKLESINLEGRRDITDVGVQSLAEHCPAMLNLNLYYCKLITDVGVQSLAEHCPAISTLDLISLAEHFPNLNIHA